MPQTFFLNKRFKKQTFFFLNTKDLRNKLLITFIFFFLFSVFTLSQTQEYKLQLKLLQEFPNLIESLDLDGKHLNDISEIIALYLSKDQPKDLQTEAIAYFKKLRNYNGPLIYLIAIKKSHLKMFEDNVRTILESFKVKNN